MIVSHCRPASVAQCVKQLAYDGHCLHRTRAAEVRS